MIRFVEYTLELNAPAVIHAIGGDPNSASTMRYIPGSMVRGAIAGILGDPDSSPRIQTLFHLLILSGKVRFLNAYPARSALRSLPSPTCFRIAKGAQTSELEVIDLSGYGHGDFPEESLKRFPDPFFELSVSPVRVKVRTGVSFHHQRDRQKGRAWQEKGTVFSYEYLQEGQTFAGVIGVEGPDENSIRKTIDELKKTSEKRPELWLGRSRRAQYGGAAALKINPEALLQREVKKTTGVLKGAIAGDSLFRILFTAAAVIRDPVSGQIDPAAIGRVVNEKFGGRVSVEEVWLDFDIAAGYNRKWGLPVVQSATLKAGTMLKLRAVKEISEADWLAIETAGIGERRTEGFGAMIFLPGETPKSFTVNNSEKPRSNMAWPAQVPSLIQRMQKDILRRELGRISAEQAFALAGKADERSIPSGSLLGRLRLPFRKSGEEAIETLKTWLGDGDHALKSTAKKQLSRCRLDGELMFSSWLSESVNRDAGHVLRGFQLDRVWTDYTMNDPEFARNCGKEILGEIRAIFIDAVLAGLARRKRQSKGQNE
ncbi:MAG: hypothetical protein HQM09_21665 [Candidatus Riflebacteria bacterium]|nr:hypothetical protein [Candidatus Riflebacteria bacterium]